MARFFRTPRMAVGRLAFKARDLGDPVRCLSPESDSGWMLLGH